MRIGFIFIISFFFSVAVNAQFPYSDSLMGGGISVKYSAQKSGGKYVLEITASDAAATMIKKKTDDPYIFYYDEVKKDLDKRYGNDAAMVPQIYSFAEKFAKRSRTVVATTHKTDRVLDLGSFQVNEFVLANGTYTYALVDKSGETLSVTILSANTAGVYSYNHANVTARNELKDNFAALAEFIKANTKIKAPQVSSKKDQTTNADQLYIKDSDGRINYINLTPAQAKDFEAQTNSGTAALASPPTATSPSAKTTATEKKNSILLLDPQLIACAGKTVFELAVFSYPGAENDSLQIEINTKAVKKLDSVHQKIGVVEFKRLVLDDPEIKKLGCADSAVSPALDIFYAKITEARKTQTAESQAKYVLDSAKKLVDEFRKPFNDHIDALAGEKGYAARIQLQDSIIPLNVKCNDDHQQQEKLTTPMLKLDSLVIRVENNLIYQIDIVGELNGKKIQTISNDKYGLSLRELIDWPSGITFYVDGKKYNVCYKNLVFVRPADGEAINYTIADAVYTLVPRKQDSQLLLQKPLLDFVSASIFLDLQAFNEKNPNKNLLTELYFDFNVNTHRLWQKLTLFRHLYTPITLATNIFKEPNALSTYRKRDFIYRDSAQIDTATVPPFYKYDTLFYNTYYLKHFDLVRNSFLQLKPTLNFFSIDYKEARAFFEGNIGLMLMGSNARVVDPSLGKDSIATVPLFSYSPLYEFRGRISPKPRFGIDMHLVYIPKLRLLNEDYKSITGPFDAETLVKAKMSDENKTGFVQGEINFFFNPKSNPSPTDRGGLYFKLNMFKATKKPDGFFMFLVGYSTDIKNFFK